MSKLIQFRIFLFCNAFVALGFTFITLPSILKSDSKSLIDFIIEFLPFYAPTLLLCSLGSFLYRKSTLAFLFLGWFAVIQTIIFLTH